MGLLGESLRGLKDLEGVKLICADERGFWYGVERIRLMGRIFIYTEDSETRSGELGVRKGVRWWCYGGKWGRGLVCLR